MRLIRMQNKYTLHIPVNICGKGLKIIHIGSILINGKAYVGKDCLPHIKILPWLQEAQTMMFHIWKME